MLKLTLFSAVLTRVLLTLHLGNNGNNHDVSKRQRGSVVDSSAQLSIIIHTYRWKVVVQRCTHYLG